MEFSGSQLTILIVFAVIFLWGTVLTLAYLLQRRWSRRANWFFAATIGLMCLGLIRVGLYHTGAIAEQAKWYFLPVWFCLAFGPCLFYATKFRLFPAYRLRLTDLKHFVLPFLQLLFYVYFLFISSKSKTEIFETFVLGRYKFAEGILFLLTFFGYLFFALRYVKFKQARVRLFQRTEALTELRHWERMLKVVFVAALINFGYIITDFVAYNFFSTNLMNVWGFQFWSDLSYALFPLVLLYYGTRFLMPAAPANKAARQVPPQPAMR